jgi:hypothetical protein
MLGGTVPLSRRRRRRSMRRRRKRRIPRAGAMRLL